MIVYETPRGGTQPLPVERLDDGGFRLLAPEGPKIFPSARQLLIELTGHPTGRNWTFDRYFKLGKWAPPAEREENQPLISTVEMFGPEIRDDERISIEMTATGIDLENRHEEVAKILFAGFGKRIYAAGYDPRDVLQEVYRGILTRNRGTCPWDPARSSFGHYVHMVCSCVLSNYHRKRNRRRGMEQVGIPGWRDGSFQMVDAGSPAALLPDQLKEFSVEREDTVRRDLLAHIFDRGIPRRDEILVERILPLICEGHTRAEIADRLGLSRSVVCRIVSLIRRHARDWA